MNIFVHQLLAPKIRDYAVKCIDKSLYLLNVFHRFLLKLLLSFRVMLIFKTEKNARLKLLII